MKSSPIPSRAGTEGLELAPDKHSVRSDGQPDTEYTELEMARSDLFACAFNYFYDGWKYRVVSGEPYESVARDCTAAAKRMLDRYEEALRVERLVDDTPRSSEHTASQRTSPKATPVNLNQESE